MHLCGIYAVFVKKPCWNVKCFRTQSFIRVESNIYTLLSHNTKRTTPHNFIQSLEKKRLHQHALLSHRKPLGGVHPLLEYRQVYKKVSPVTHP